MIEIKRIEHSAVEVLKTSFHSFYKGKCIELAIVGVVFMLFFYVLQMNILGCMVLSLVFNRLFSFVIVSIYQADSTASNLQKIVLDAVRYITSYFRRTNFLKYLFVISIVLSLLVGKGHLNDLIFAIGLIGGLFLIDMLFCLLMNGSGDHSTAYRDLYFYTLAKGWGDIKTEPDNEYAAGMFAEIERNSVKMFELNRQHIICNYLVLIIGCLISLGTIILFPSNTYGFLLGFLLWGVAFILAKYHAYTIYELATGGKSLEETETVIDGVVA